MSVNNGLNFVSPSPSELSVSGLFPIFGSLLLECGWIKVLFSLLLYSGDQIQLHLLHSNASVGVEES